MAAHIIAQAGADGLGSLGEILQQLLGREFGQFGMIDEQPVRIIDVGLMMLVVVNLHRPGVDVRLERLIGIRQRRQGVGTGRRGRRGSLGKSLTLPGLGEERRGDGTKAKAQGGAAAETGDGSEVGSLHG